jgi:Fic family protein
MYVAPAPQIEDLIAKLDRGQLAAAAIADLDPRSRRGYAHWDKIRRLDPPAGLTREQWWLKLKLARRDGWRPLPLLDRDGRALGYTLPDEMLPSLRRIDRRQAESAGRGGLLSWDEALDRLFVNSAMEEAIRSSQLEGASTTRGDGKELLVSARQPRDRGERMIFNNYAALRFMRERVGSTLTPEKILELHRILTVGTLTDPAAAGRLEQPGEERIAVRDHQGEVLYQPPPADQLPERIERLCEFANAGEEEDPFMHPVLRAVLLHFGLAYDHPFLDGNGRTARILFFWAMRKQGYRFAEYLPISRLIRRAHAKYERAFLETETDGGDTTYFLMHQLGIIERAIADFDVYVARKEDEQLEIKQRLPDIGGINGRQLVLLTHALKHPEHTYTFGGHARSNRVTHETARADLSGLAERGLLIRRRQGRPYIFEPAPDLPSLLKESTA